MQLMILGDESPRLLRLASQFLLDVAQVQEAELKNGGPLMPAEPSAAVLAAEAAAEDGIALAVAAPSVPVPPSPPVNPDVTAEQNPGTGELQPKAAPTLDKRGFPHDARIHSKEPKLNADGTWRARRNLDNALLESVEAELRAQGYGNLTTQVLPVTVNVGPGVAAVQVPLPPPVGAPLAPVVAAPDAPAAPQVMVPPPPRETAPSVAPAVPAAPPAQSVSTFQVLMQRVSRNAQGVCSNAAIAPTWAKLGVKGWADFFQRPDLIPAMTTELDNLGAAP